MERHQVVVDFAHVPHYIASNGHRILAKAALAKLYALKHCNLLLNRCVVFDRQSPENREGAVPALN